MPTAYVLMILLTVALVPVLNAYAIDKVDVEILPSPYSPPATQIFWSLEDNPDRVFCFAKTEIRYMYWPVPTNDTYVEFPVKTFFGSEYWVAKDNGFHTNIASDIPESAKVPCEGNFRFSAQAIFPDSYYWYDLSTYTSFGEGLSDGTVEWLHEGVVNVATIDDGFYTKESLTDCHFDTFDKTTNLTLMPTWGYKSTQYKGDNGECDYVLKDLKDYGLYKYWFDYLAKN